jgi:selenide,water dikinase
MTIALECLPLYDGVFEAARRGVRTGGDARNRQQFANRVAGLADDTYAALLFDPQTSGGLLATVDHEHVASLEHAGFTRIGVVEGIRLTIV